MVENVDYGLAIPESDQEFVILPDKVKVIREVTEDESYTNAALAQI